MIEVFSALVSVSLIVLTSTALISQFEHGTVRTSIGLVVIYLLSFYYASQFINYYLQGSYFNQQYLFHFNLTTLRESLAAYYSLMFLIAGWTACVLFGFYYLRAQLPRSSHSLPALAGLFVLALMLDPGLRPSVFAMANSALSPRIDSLEAIAWEELSLEQDALTNTQFTSTPGKNLLFIFLEGFETGQLGYASAVAWALFALVFVLSIFNFRYGNRHVDE